MIVCLWYDRFLANAKARGKVWASLEEYRRLPLVCVGGPLNAISQFWLVRRPIAALPFSYPTPPAISKYWTDQLILVN